MVSRRGFLADTSLALAGNVLLGHSLTAERLMAPNAAIIQIPSDVNVAPELLLSAISAAELHELAARAMDAARAAGARYADIRLAEIHEFWPGSPACVLSTQFTFGVRALVDGSWGFAFGREPKPEAVARCAEDAVSSARVASRLTGNNTIQQRDNDSWFPAPVQTGEWQTPVQIDAFTVPIRQHLELLSTLDWAVSRAFNTVGYVKTIWTKELRVFAATTGTQLTQRLSKGDLRPAISITYGRNNIVVRVPGLENVSGGYEILIAADLPDRIKAASESMLWLSRFPVRTMDIGKYPALFNGHAMSDVLNLVVGPSATLDRVLGHHRDTSEGSRWSTDLLGTPIASPLLTITGNRSLPSTNAVKWDDEGGVPVEHTVIKNGLLNDYHTSGTTVGALNDWYIRQGWPLQSNGCATAVTPNSTIVIRPPDLSLAPSKIALSLEDMCKDMKRGVLVLDDYYTRVDTDQQLTSGALDAGRMMFEVSQGKIVKRLQKAALQFSTIPLLKGAIAVGDASTVRSSDSKLYQGLPWEANWQKSKAPAVLFKEINVVQQ